MKTLKRIESFLEWMLCLNGGAFIGLAIAAAGMHNGLLALTTIILFVNIILEVLTVRVIENKIKDIKEREWI